jgi:hypothetical protein
MKALLLVDLYQLSRGAAAAVSIGAPSPAEPGGERPESVGKPMQPLYREALFKSIHVEYLFLFVSIAIA